MVSHRDMFRRSRGPESANLRGPIACALLAVAALSLGPSGDSALRSAVRDAALPGYLLNQRISKLGSSLDFGRWPWTADANRKTTTSAGAQTGTAERELRDLRAALAAARAEIAAYARSLGPVRASTATLPSVQRIPARVLAVPGPASETIVLTPGAPADLASDQLAIEQLVLTSGVDPPENAAVLAGAAVVGRIKEVGRWTATLLSVTHKEFRAHVRIVRMTAAGPVYGEEGVLEGDGRGGCVVRYIPSTVPVSIGDHVYSYDPTGRIPQPLDYGRIERADLREGAPHWEVAVRPAAEPARFTELHVLVPTAPVPSGPLARTP